MSFMTIFVLVIFILTYLLIIALPKYKLYIAGVSALACGISILASGLIGVGEFFTGIDYNVIMILLGIMLTVGFFTQSGMPKLLAEKFISIMPNSLCAVTFLCVLSGIISAFIDNVATVLMLAPIGIALAKKLDLPLIPVIVGIAVSSNLQGAATLVGDTTSVMLASEANMSFLDFFIMNGKPSIFFAVELGALATIPVFVIMFRKHNKKLDYKPEKIKITSKFPTIMLCSTIVCLVASSFIPVNFEYMNGIICMVFGIACFVYYLFKLKKEALSIAKDAIDFQTIGFLFFLFIIIMAVDRVGIISALSDFLKSIGEGNILLLYVIIVYGSMIISAFIDNIPYVMTMLPVITGIVNGLPVGTVRPELLYFGLLIGATLGGNLTPIGASANVVGTGILRKEGVEVKFKDFAKVGIPFTLLAVTVGGVFNYLMWGL